MLNVKVFQNVGFPFNDKKTYGALKMHERPLINNRLLFRVIYGELV